MDLGVPSVRYCAEQLAYSPRYLGDVIHSSTGGTAIGYITSSLGLTGSVRRIIRSLSTETTPSTLRK